MTPKDALIEKKLREQQTADTSPLQVEVDRQAALIERMARAIWEATPPIVAGTDYVRPWDELREEWREIYRVYARAAYEAEHEEEG